jgi:hypothetical protein
MLDCWINNGSCLSFCWMYIWNFYEPAQLHLIGEAEAYGRCARTRGILKIYWRSLRNLNSSVDWQVKPHSHYRSLGPKWPKHNKWVSSLKRFVYLPSHIPNRPDNSEFKLFRFKSPVPPNRLASSLDPDNEIIERVAGHSLHVLRKKARVFLGWRQGGKVTLLGKRSHTPVGTKF